MTAKNNENFMFGYEIQILNPQTKSWLIFFEFYSKTKVDIAIEKKNVETVYWFFTRPCLDPSEKIIDNLNIRIIQLWKEPSKGKKILKNHVYQETATIGSKNYIITVSPKTLGNLEAEPLFKGDEVHITDITSPKKNGTFSNDVWEEFRYEVDGKNLSLLVMKENVESCVKKRKESDE